MSPDASKSPAAPAPLTREVTVLNRYGIHARPAVLLVKEAVRFPCEILIEKNGVCVNAKSIMGLLTLEGHHGARLRITATGPEAAAALDALAELFERKFFED